MLGVSEIGAGTLENAPLGSLLLPRTKYEAPFLVGGTPEARVALCLGLDYQFQGFRCADCDNWRGLLIPSVAIEVDQASAFDPQDSRVPPGAVVRKADRLDLAVAFGERIGAMRPSMVPFQTGLPPCEQGYSVGFLKWQIVLGDGIAKRVLHTVDLVADASA